MLRVERPENPVPAYQTAPGDIISWGAGSFALRVRNQTYVKVGDGKGVPIVWLSSDPVLSSVWGADTLRNDHLVFVVGKIVFDPTED